MTRVKTIPVASPCFTGNEQAYVMECLETMWVSSLGRFIPLFEQKFAEFCDVEHAVSANNGTSALHLALLGFDTGPGDEIIVPALTFVASANAVKYCGATPVFVDSEPRTMNLDPRKIEERITERTRGIMVVHLYGHPADMDPILEIAKRHNLFVIEDAAEAHGALYKGTKVGGIGNVASFSFYGNKIITTGEGGMVTTRDAALSRKIRMFRGQGMDPERRYWFPVVGYNYRMTNIAAAIGLAQTEQIALHTEKRRCIAEQYNASLERVRHHVTLPLEEPWARHAFWAYVIVLKDSVRQSRDEMMAQLLDEGIETRPVFYPMHLMPPYREPDGTYPVAERLGERGIVLPAHSMLEEDDVAYVAEAIIRLCN